MEAKTRTTGPAKVKRTSVSFDPETYDELARQAEAKRVSVAWVIRDAVEHHLRSQEPVFSWNNDEEGGS